MSFNLEHALEDLAEAGASRRTADDDALTSRVGAMATRIRRRRALRYTSTTVVAACAVGALAVGVAQLPGLLANGPTPPAGSPSVDPSPTTEATLSPFTLSGACGTTLPQFEQRVRLEAFVREESSTPQTDDAGYAEVLSITQDANGAAAELEYYLPNGAQLLELGWTLFLVDADGVIVATAETGLGPAVSPPGTTSTGTVTALPDTPCGGDEPLLSGSFDLIAVAEAHGSLASGAAFAQRAVGVTYPIELGGIDPEPDNPFGEVFACGQPGPDSIHTLPDAGGLTLAVDLPEGPWSGAAVPQIAGFVGASGGQTVLANITQGVSGALVDSDGIVVGFVVPDGGDVDLAEITPETQVETVADQILVMCGPDGSLGSAQDVEGTYTLWPYVTAVLKEVTDAEGNATTPSSDPVIVIANPQEVTLVD